MIQDSSFERIRSEIEGDMRRVRPLKPAWHSAFIALPIALFTTSLVLVVYGLRQDAAQVGVWPLWGPVSLMVATSYVVLVLALMQRAPESSVSWVSWIGLPLAAMALQVGGAMWTLSYSHEIPVASLSGETMCFWRITMLGVPPVLVVLLVLSRGLPLRPKLAGLLAGMGGGLISEAVYRLHCAMGHPGHVIPWHTGAILVTGLLGFLAGLWWDRRRLKLWQAR